MRMSERERQTALAAAIRDYETARDAATTRWSNRRGQYVPITDGVAAR